MRCPKCGSSDIKKISIGKKIGGLAGAAKGAAFGSTIAPGIGTVLGLIGGALNGAVMGKKVDSVVLINRKCKICNHIWHED